MQYVGGEKELTFFLTLSLSLSHINFLILLKCIQADKGTRSLFSIPNISEISLISYMKAFNPNENAKPI